MRCGRAMLVALWSGHDDNLLSPPNVETNCKFVKFDNFVKLVSLGRWSGCRPPQTASKVPTMWLI
jgi:hypothetical protein